MLLGLLLDLQSVQRLLSWQALCCPSEQLLPSPGLLWVVLQI